MCEMTVRAHGSNMLHNVRHLQLELLSIMVHGTVVYV